MKFVSNSFERDVFFLQDLALSYDLLQEEKLADALHHKEQIWARP